MPENRHADNLLCQMQNSLNENDGGNVGLRETLKLEDEVYEKPQIVAMNRKSLEINKTVSVGEVEAYIAGSSI